MDKEYYLDLAKIRIERAQELLAEANDLLEKESYKSANNRAFYAIEKAVKALLATESVEVATHNGGLHQFNYLFVHKGDGTFTQEDYKRASRAERVRAASDYDDFYIASKEEAKQQVNDAQYIVDKVQKYIKDKC